MTSLDVLHDCGWNHMLLALRQQRHTAPLEVLKDNMWVVAPPCSQVSQLARRIRDHSSKEGDIA
eukprot:12550267-Prorocentrum_lima.AAC.1